MTKAKSNNSSVIENIKKLHAARSIERKDLSLKELVEKEKDADGIVVIDVVGFASKYVPKYHNDNNEGYHTMIYLADGRKTGAFSSALLDLARFFYEGAGMDTSNTFNAIRFGEGDHIQIAVSVVPLDGKKSTYNFEIVSGEINNEIEKVGQLTTGGTLLLE